MPTITPGSAFSADYKPQINWDGIIKAATTAQDARAKSTAAVERGKIQPLTKLSAKSEKTTDGRKPKKMAPSKGAAK